MDSQSIISSRTKLRSRHFSLPSLLKMTRSSADRKIKLRKLGRRLKTHFKPRPISSSSSHIPPQELRNAKSVLSLKPVRDLVIHQVSEPIPVPSVNHRSVRFSHPTVRHVISALPTPLSTAGRPIPESSHEYDSPANIDFPGQVNASVIYNRRSNVTNSVLFEEIFDQLDGILAHPRDSKLLQRREDMKQLVDERHNTIFINSNEQTEGKPWPVEGICGTNPVNFKTKSGLRALQYLSFHAPIREEAFSDEEIFGTTEPDRSREQHLQATLEQLSIPREKVDTNPDIAHFPNLQPGAFDQEGSIRLPYLAFKTAFPSELTGVPELSNAQKRNSQRITDCESHENRPMKQPIQYNLEWEKALLTFQHCASGTTSSPAIESRDLDTKAIPTPDFPSTKTTSSKRRTLLQSTALDLYLATPVTFNPSITPSFPVLDQERELHRRTIVGEQQRDLALTPALAFKPSPALPRTFSIPRRGVGQASKPQAISGLPLPSSRPGTGGPQSSFTTAAHSVSTSAVCSAQATGEDNDLRRTSSSSSSSSSSGSHYSLQSEFSIRLKISRLEKFKKIVTKNY